MNTNTGLIAICAGAALYVASTANAPAPIYPNATPITSQQILERRIQSFSNTLAKAIPIQPAPYMGTNQTLMMQHQTLMSNYVAQKETWQKQLLAGQMQVIANYQHEQEQAPYVALITLGTFLGIGGLGLLVTKIMER